MTDSVDRAKTARSEDWLIGQLRASLDREERLVRAIVRHRDLLSFGADEEEENPLVGQCKRIIALCGLNDAIGQWKADVRKARSDGQG